MGNEDQGSVRGKGREMVPDRGLPFDLGDAVPMGGERRLAALDAEPRDLSAAELAALIPGAQPAPAAAYADSEAAGETAAREPSSAADREAALGPAAGMMSAEDLAALDPSSHTERDPDALGAAMAGGADTSLIIPPGAAVMPGVPTTAPGQAIPDRTAVGGVVLRGVQAFTDKPLEISEAAAGISAQAYDLGEALPGSPDLVNIFVPDGRLTTIWLDIDSIEQQVSTTRGVSLKVARELLDRLAKARNFLMNDRANYEEASRQLAEVKYRLTRIKNSPSHEHAPTIALYLVIVALLIFLGFAATAAISKALSGPISANATFDFAIVWQAMLWGSVGGFFGAAYGLWVHVSRDQDYEPQYALWYYSNPPIGLVLGAFMYVIVQILQPVLLGGGQADASLQPYVLYFLAWVVGFQQNVVFAIVNSILKRIIPADEKGGDSRSKTQAAAQTPGPGAATPGAGQIGGAAAESGIGPGASANSPQ